MEFDLSKEEFETVKRALLQYRGGIGETILLESFVSYLEHCGETGTTLHINFSE